MDYGEASRFAEVYKVQETYNELTIRMLSQFPPSFSLVLHLQHDYRASGRELEAYKQAVLSDWAFVYMHGTIGEALNKKYAEILSEQK